MSLTFAEYPIRLTGSQNVREHWRARAKRVKKERSTAEVACQVFLERPKQWPVTVRLTRIGPRKLDSDNVAGACKATRDGVADWLRVDDGDESKVRWEYSQCKSAASYAYGVRIELLSKDALADERARALSTKEER
jgi:hypothetical protein